MSEAVAPLETVFEERRAGWLDHLQRAWSLDLRSLALFRVSIAGLILVDLITRATELRTFYTDFGILPRSAWHSVRPAGFWSLHVLFGSGWMQGLLCMVAAAFALMLLVGWQTRLASVASWLLLVSAQNRMPATDFYGDTLLRMLLFWGMFLPLGSRWSVDGARRGFVRDAEGAEDEFAVFSPAGIAFMLQVAFVFAFGYLWKNSPEWKSGRAMLYALNMEQWATTSGRGMLHFPAVLSLLSHYARTADLLTPLLIFVPWKYGRVRTWTVVAVIMLQVVMAMVLRLGLFPFAVMAALLALLPAWYWQTQERSAYFSDHLEWDLAERFAPSGGARSVPRFVPIAAGAFVSLAVCLVIFWNVAGLRGTQSNSAVQRIAYALRVDQKWDLLAPHPYVDDGWYVAPTTLANGSQVDLFRNGAPVKWYKPPQDAVFRQASSQHLLVFLARLHAPEFAAYRPLYAQYLCRSWNEERGNSHTNNVEVDFMRRMNLFDHSAYGPARKYPLAKETCQ